MLGARQRPDIDWVYISMHLFSNQRDPDDCKLHWQNFLHPSVNKDTWSTDESKLLLKTVELHQVKLMCILCPGSEIGPFLSVSYFALKTGQSATPILGPFCCIIIMLTFQQI